MDKLSKHEHIFFELNNFGMTFAGLLQKAK